MGVQTSEFRAGVVALSITPALVAAQTTAEQTFPLKGLKITDAVFVVKPSHSAGVMPVHARCSGPDTIAICFNNPTAGGLTPPAETYLVYWFRGEKLDKNVVV